MYEKHKEYKARESSGGASSIGMFAEVEESAISKFGSEATANDTNSGGIELIV